MNDAERNKPVTVEHWVSIAGCVREEPSAVQAVAQRDGELRVAGALVEIIAGPPEFAALAAAQRAALAAGARLRGRRWDRTYSQADGLYFFHDLPPGDYSLRVTAPNYGTRFGGVESEQPIRVPPPPAAQEKWGWATFDVLLPATRLRGVVRRKDTGAPLPMATVRLLGAAAAVRTDLEGNFELRRLPAGKVIIDVAAGGLRGVQQAVIVEAGKEAVIEDIHLSK